MMYRDTLKNQQFQVRKLKRVLKRQEDRHPAVTTSKLLIFLVASFLLSFQITLKVNFSKKCERGSHGPCESGQDALLSAGSVSDKVIPREPLKALGTGAGNMCRLQAVPFQLSHGALADEATATGQ